MRIKKLVKLILIGCSIVALSACSSTHKNRNFSDGMGGDASGAQASGIGGSSGFGDQGLSPEQLLEKRVYYFDYDRSDVRPDDKPAIFAQADYLIAHPRTRIIIEGHTDPRGSREYNVALGERRARAVASMLESKGVGGAQIRVVSYGAEKLATPGRSEEDYQQDRRAVIVHLQR